jgi:hypothetical protein
MEWHLDRHANRGLGAKVRGRDGGMNDMLEALRSLRDCPKLLGIISFVFKYPVTDRNALR